MRTKAGGSPIDGPNERFIQLTCQRNRGGPMIPRRGPKRVCGLPLILDNQ